jgi:sulfoxide reductase heme-binding subunit YedZ
VHWFAYAAWPVALLHGLGTGTDNGQLWLWCIAMACVAAVFAAICWRLSDGFDRSATRRRRVSSSNRTTPADPIATTSTGGSRWT